MIAEPETLKTILTHALVIYWKVGLRLGYGPGKTELILLRGHDRGTCPYPLDNLAIPAPHVVEGFEACLGVPRHHANDQAFSTNALRSTAWERSTTAY